MKSPFPGVDPYIVIQHPLRIVAHDQGPWATRNERSGAASGLGPSTAGISPPQPLLFPSVFPSGRNVVDLEPILGLQAPDRVGHLRLILFGVGKGQVRAI